MSHVQGLLMPFFMLGADVDPRDAYLRQCSLTLTTNKGDATGTFVEVLPGYLYIALGDVFRGGKCVKPGMWFVRDKRASTECRVMFRAYDNAYSVIRTSGTYAKGWGMFQVSASRNLHGLAMADLADTRLLCIMTAKEHERLVRRCTTILKGKHGASAKDALVCRAIAAAIDACEQNERSLRRRGLANVADKVVKRVADPTKNTTVIVTLSTVVADYMGAAVDVVRRMREFLDRLLACDADTLFARVSADMLDTVKFWIWRACDARPTTDVGDRVGKDCDTAADLVRKGTKGDASERAVLWGEIHDLLGNARDSLDFLLWQYDVATFVAEVAPRVRAGEGLTEEEWRLYAPRIADFEKRIAPPFGERFVSGEPLTRARSRVSEAAEYAKIVSERFDPDTSAYDLKTVKDYLTEAMRSV